MADTVTGPTILQQNDKRVTIKIVNQSDGTGGTTVFADVSALAANAQGQSCTTVSLQRVWWSCSNGDGQDSFARLDYEDSDGNSNSKLTLTDFGCFEINILAKDSTNWLIWGYTEGADAPAFADN